VQLLDGVLITLGPASSNTAAQLASRRIQQADDPLAPARLCLKYLSDDVGVTTVTAAARSRRSANL